MTRFVAGLSVTLFSLAASFTAATQGSLGAQIAAGAATASSPLARHEHPRMLNLDSTRKAAHQAALQNRGAHVVLYQRFVDSIDSTWGSITSEGTYRRAYLPFSLAKIWYLHSGPAGAKAGTYNGIRYDHGKDEYLAKALESMDAIKVTVGRQATYAYSYALCFAYDVLASPGGMSSAKKTEYIDWFKTVTDHTAANYPMKSFSTQVVHAYAMMMACGLAVSGDAEDTAGWGAARVAEWSTHWVGPGGVIARWAHYMGTVGGDFPEGNLYQWYDGEVQMLVTMEAYRQANADGGAAENASKASFYGSPPANVVQVVPFSWASYILPYAVVDTSRPGGAQGRRWHFFVPFYGAIQEIDLYNTTMITSPTVMAAAGINNGLNTNASQLAQWALECKFEVRTRCGGGSDNPMTLASYTADFRSRGVIYTAFVGSSEYGVRAPAAAGVATTFRNMSRFIVRPSYTDPDSAFVTVEAQQWLGGLYGPRCPGSVMIMRKGPMLWRKGNEEGHDRMSAGGLRFGMCSAPLFHPANVTNPDYAVHNYGGPKSDPNISSVSEFTQGGRLDALTAYRDSIGSGSPKIHATYNDITAAYNHVGPSDPIGDRTEPDEVSRAERIVNIVEPATAASDPVIVVVMDRAVPETSNNEPRILWTPSGIVAPTFDGSTSPGPARCPTAVKADHTESQLPTSPCTQGKVYTTNSTRVSWSVTGDNMDGTCHMTVVLPASNRMVLVGGPNAAGQNWQATGTYSHEGEDSFGLLWRPRLAASANISSFRKWSGAYRIETTDPANGHKFLHFLKCGNSGLSYAPPTSLLRNGAGDNDFVGVVDRLLGFVFGEDTDSKTTGDIDWCPADGTYTVTWNDLLASQNRTLSFPTGGGITSINGETDGSVIVPVDAGGVARPTIVVNDQSNCTITVS